MSDEATWTWHIPMKVFFSEYTKYGGSRQWDRLEYTVLTTNHPLDTQDRINDAIFDLEAQRAYKAQEEEGHRRVWVRIVPLDFKLMHHQTPSEAPWEPWELDVIALACHSRPLPDREFSSRLKAEVMKICTDNLRRLEEDEGLAQIDPELPRKFGTDRLKTTDEKGNTE